MGLKVARINFDESQGYVNGKGTVVVFHHDTGEVYDIELYYENENWDDQSFGPIGLQGKKALVKGLEMVDEGYHMDDPKDLHMLDEG